MNNAVLKYVAAMVGCWALLVGIPKLAIGASLGAGAFLYLQLRRRKN